MKKYTIHIKILPQYVHLYPECVNGVKSIFANELQYKNEEEAKQRYEELYLGTFAEQITVESEVMDLPFDVKGFLEDLNQQHSQSQNS